MTGTEVKKLNDEQIKAELADLRGKLLTLRSQSATEKVEDNTQFGKIRKDIARLLGELNARRPKAAAATKAAPAPKAAAKPAAKATAKAATKAKAPAKKKTAVKA